MRNLKEEPIKTVFLGTDWESTQILNELYNDKRFNIKGVITNEDKPVGRNQLLTPSKVKEFGLKHNIDVFHTNSNTERYKKALKKFNPELIVCIAFGEILPDFFINYPKYKSINIHFSILRKYRGAVPVQKAILDGEKETGISIMIISQEMDKGDILKIFKEPILPDDTNISLRQRLVKISSDVIGDVLEEWVEGNIVPQKQDDSLASYCWQKDISKEKAQIQWESMNPEYIERMIRAFIPWPVAWCILNDKRLKILEAQLIKKINNEKAGTLFISDSLLLFSTKEKNICLSVNSLQIEGKNVMNYKEFINGFGKDIKEGV
jgi:methionyl-tRNA formyltransferase